MSQNNMKNVLTLATYPIKTPYHGGQNRLSELVQAYKQAGFLVKSVAVYEEEAYQKAELQPEDIPFPQESIHRRFRGQLFPNSSDVMAGEYIIKDVEAWQKLAGVVREMRPSIIHFEQPSLFPAVRRIKSEFPDLEIFTIFGSQNIESPLKKEILEKSDFLDQEIVRDFVSMVKEREIEAANFADLVLAVTAEDLAWFKKNSQQRSYLLIPNGVREMKHNLDIVKKIKTQARADKWISYVASAHPPNIDGFFECMGEALGCIPPNGKLLLAGSVSTFIVQQLRASRMLFLNESRVFSFGKVDQNVLDNIILGSQAVILPMTSGGGSNLKTAEALASGNYVVATQKALRGYEEFKDISGVVCKNTRQSFQKAVRTAFLQPKLSRLSEEVKRTNTLLWSERVKPLIEFLQKDSFKYE